MVIVFLKPDNNIYLGHKNTITVQNNENSHEERVPTMRAGDGNLRRFSFCRP